MSVSPPADLTALLVASRAGDRRALDQVITRVYTQLRDIAHRELARDRYGHTLDSVALVNEAYLKLVRQDGIEWQNRAHFFAIAARTMRTILIDYARARSAAKRGGGLVPLSLDRVADAAVDAERAEHPLALDDALSALAAVNEEAGRVVEYRYFAGLSLEEIAEVLQTSVATVRRRWAFAKAWLGRELQSGT